MNGKKCVFKIKTEMFFGMITDIKGLFLYVRINEANIESAIINLI